MNSSNYINISINISNGNLCFSKNENPAPPSPFVYTGENDSAANNVRIEVGIAKIFHKVLNLIKADPDLFQKEDFELLGEMLAKILFGKSEVSNFRNYIMTEVEQTLEINNRDSNKLCRVFLEFDQASKVAMLPWEYTLYKTRSKPPISWYISANVKSRFHLIRRVRDNPPVSPEATELLVIVVANVLGNSDAEPPIDNRTLELSKIKQSFEGLIRLHDEDPISYPYPIKIEYLERISLKNLKTEIEKVYQSWADEHGDNPTYVLHYIGHATMIKEIGNIVVANDEGKMEWVEDESFASVFNMDSLNIPQPAMACFQACDSAKIGTYKNELRGVAYEFTKLNIPAVIGMQNEINTPASCAFFEVFYKSILAAKDVSEAVTAGRDFLGRELYKPKLYINNSFGSPVLFITTKEPIRIMKEIELQPFEDAGEIKAEVTNSTRPSDIIREVRARSEERNITVPVHAADNLSDRPGKQHNLRERSLPDEPRTGGNLPQATDDV